MSWKLYGRFGPCLVPGNGILDEGSGGEYDQTGGLLFEEEVCADKALSPFQFTISDSYG